MKKKRRYSELLCPVLGLLTLGAALFNFIKSIILIYFK